ncbi:hypothetical protein PEX2_074600 [Penicillium expansum]|uniref:Uncharacterized protein n=1 Tax=Penicillium expansum TaxID=27334 RepID=A0A0A2I8A6_PENEN|nr:hypothetical protein PEX2_074600 [Penicillium expansum]KGO38616.1 hypothetical protein PEXP_083090 [Penicillium expansum]KGO59480.1 hypothetical protein PEX2_074600 [Penicillium expansum]
MASDQRFQRTVQAVAEAVQVFAAGTFDFAESIKQIWRPQAQPDALETSNLLPVEGMQDVQIVGQLRERIPVSQDGDQLAIHSHTYPPSVTLHNGEGVSEISHETTVPVETANMELSNNMDVLAGSIHRSIRSCYECFVRWRDESPFPPCHSITGQQTCNYCLRNQIPCDMIPAGEMGKMLQRRREADLYRAAQNGNVPIKREPFEHPFYGTSEQLEIPLSSPIGDTPQQQASSKRVYQDIDEQQPVAKRQQTQGLRQKPMPNPCGGEKVIRQEQDGYGATGDGESSSSLEEEGLQMGANRQESWPIKISDLLRVPEKVTHELEVEVDVSSSSTQGKSSAESSSEEEDDDYSSEEEEQAVQIPAVRSRQENSESSSSSSEDESSEEDSDDEPGEPKQQLIAKEELLKELKDNSEELIQLPDNESSNSSSEDGSSDEESEHEPEEQQRIQLAPEAFLQEKRREMMRRMKEAITNLEEDISESESSSSSSEDESSEEESDDKPEEPTKQPGTKEQPPKEPIHPSDDESSDSSSEDESSEEESEEEPEQPKKQPATKVELGKSREEKKPEEPIGITSDEASSLSDGKFSEEDSDMEI